jgi:hypothetical protein
VLLQSVRQQFKANMKEVDDDKVRRLQPLAEHSTVRKSA